MYMYCAIMDLIELHSLDARSRLQGSRGSIYNDGLGAEGGYAAPRLEPLHSFTV